MKIIIQSKGKNVDLIDSRNVKLKTVQLSFLKRNILFKTLIWNSLSILFWINLKEKGGKTWRGRKWP